MNWKKQFFDFAFPLKKDDVKIDEAFKLLAVNLPRYLYKYRNVDENGFSILKTGSIWMARPDTLNDPYDCWYSYGGKEIVKIYERNLRNRYPGTHHDIVKEWRKESKSRLLCSNNKLRDDFRNTVKLCSLSDSHNIYKMWRDYSNNGTGFCIEFDMHLSENSIVQDTLPVLYSKNRVSFLQYIDLIFKNKTQVNGKFIRRALLTKDRKWSYEQEWRIVRPDDCPQSGIELSGLHISAVFLGKNISEKDEAHINSICYKKSMPTAKI